MIRSIIFKLPNLQTSVQAGTQPSNQHLIHHIIEKPLKKNIVLSPESVYPTLHSIHERDSGNSIEKNLCLDSFQLIQGHRLWALSDRGRLNL